jgi:hypothetical protein
MLLSIWVLCAAGYWSFVPTGSKCTQATSAAASWELLTPSCSEVGNFPLPVGSGKLSTPWDRMHWANRRGLEEVATLPPFDATVVVVDPTLATFGELGVEQALSAMETATARAAKPQKREFLKGWTRLDRIFQMKWLAQSPLLATCTLRLQRDDEQM